MVQDILENDTFAANDSFFLAGGHSLLGMQLLMHLRDEFGVDLTLSSFLKRPQ